jgi:hypothetical protein
MKFWDGRPIIFTCCKRREDGNGGPGDIFWCIAFELVDKVEQQEEISVEDISGDID